jgi:hypothetical protein
MAEVEDQRMTQRDRLAQIGFFAGQHFEQLLVAAERGVEVVAQRGAHGVRITLIESGRAQEQRVLLCIHLLGVLLR